MKILNCKEIPHRITLILTSNGKKQYIRPSIRKVRKFLKNKAKFFLKHGNLITIRVVYKDGSCNTGTYNKIRDLEWAFQAFIKEYLE